MPHSTAQPRPEVLHLDGDLDLYAAERVQAALLASLHGAEAEVDLAGVTGCDAAGVQLLLSAQATAAARCQRFHFTSIPEPVAACCRRLGLPPIT